MFLNLDVFSQFGKKDVVPETVRDRIESFAPPELPDTVLTRASGGYISTAINYNQTGVNEVEKISNWRTLAQCPEVAWAVNEICNDAVILDYENFPCELTVDEESELSDKLRDTLTDEFKHVLKLLNFKRNGIELFKQWYIDGKVYYHGVLDADKPKLGLVAVRWIDPRNMKRVVEVDDVRDAKGFVIDKITRDYYVYQSSFGFKTNYNYSQQYNAIQSHVAIRVNPEAVAYSNSGIFFEKGDGTNFSLSYLDAALRPYNTLTSLEQAMTIYRIARAPERRVFYVDTGNLNKDKADQYLSNVMARFKRKLTFNSATGTVTSENGELGVMDDFWLPRKEGGRGTEVTTLQSGSAWSDMNDLEWFQKKTLRALNIPFGRYQSDNLFSSGRSMEITREEVKFAKFITTLRAKYSQALIQLLKIHVIAKNIMSIEEFEQYSNELNVKWATDAYWDESLFNEMWQQRLQLSAQFEPLVGKYVSNDWLQRNVLQMTEEEMKEERKKILAEQKDPIFKPKEDEEENGKGWR